MPTIITIRNSIFSAHMFAYKYNNSRIRFIQQVQHQPCFNKVNISNLISTFLVFLYQFFPFGRYFLFGGIAILCFPV